MGPTNVHSNTKAVVAVLGETTPDPLVGPVRELKMLSTQAECDDAPACGECWWDIHAVARELWIDNTGGGANLPNEGTFDSLARPRSEIKHRVTWSVGSGGGRSLYFDLNGQRVAVAGDTIQTSLIVPQINIIQQAQSDQYSNLGGQLQNNRLPTGLVCITTVKAWAYQTLGPIGGREGRYTTRLQVLAAGPLPQVFIPPGATDLQITGTDTIAWDWVDRTPTAAGTIVGRVNALLSESATVPVPGNAKLIQPAALPPANARYSLSWILRF